MTDAAMERDVRRVLVVDDDPGVLQALRRELLRKPDITDSALEIEAFGSALDALNRIGSADGDFDIAVVDYRMPYLDGITLLADFHRLHPTAARILISGEADSAAALRAINEAAVDFIVTKPWHEYDLKGCMVAAMKEAELRRRLAQLTVARRDGPYRLMLVDDETSILKALVREIGAGGAATCSPRPLFEIRAYAGASQALADVRAFRPDLVISDYAMPGMDGIAFLHLLREHVPDAVRIMLSGRSGLELLVRAVNIAGVFHFLAKPWSALELRMTICHALDYRDLLAAQAGADCGVVQA